MAEKHMRLLSEARHEDDTMEINIPELYTYYTALSKNASELFWEITQNQSLTPALAEERCNAIVRD
jgi:hypothetical protein